MDILERIAVALEHNAVALARNNELLEASAEGRERAIAAAQAATTKPAAAKPAAAKAADKPAEKPAEEPKAAAAGAPNIDAVKAAVVGYTEGTEGAERDARKAKIAEVFGKVGATNVGTIPTDKYKAVIKALTTLTEQGNVLADEEPAADEDDDDLLGG